MVTTALTSTFEILPAIDLRGGRVVRLRQGDFRRQTVYSDDAVAVALGFVQAGARWLHVVDLDGARSGTPAHNLVIRDILRSLADRAAVEVAGGLRSVAAVADAFDIGASRIVLGTAALRDPQFATTVVAAYGADRVTVALDVRDGVALGDGWRRETGGVRAENALRVLADAGVRTFEATAISRDGLLAGPDTDLLGRLVAVDRGGIIASGGITSLDDLRVLRELGCAGAIVGRAFYEGRLDLHDAMGLATR